MTSATPPLAGAAPPTSGANRATAACARCSSLEAQLIELRAANAQLQARLAGLEHEKEEGIALLDSPMDEVQHCEDDHVSTAAAPSHSLATTSNPLAYSSFSRLELQRYGRQMLVKEFGAAAQGYLCRAKVLVLGVGGLGSPVAMYLAAMGVGTLGLVDSDDVERSNLHRQVLHDEHAASHRELKVFSAQRRLRELNPLVNCVPYATRFSAVNARALVDAHDVVVDASDNVGTRYLVNDACARSHTPLVSGSALGLEGQVTVFPFSDDHDAAGCYRCLYPTPPRTVRSCSENGVLGVVPGVIGCLQAMETVKVLTGVGEPLVGVQCFYDAYDGQFRRLKLGKKRDPACPACGINAGSRGDTSSGLPLDAVLLSEGGAVCTDGMAASTELAPEFRISTHEFAKVREAALAAQGDAQQERYVLLDTRARNQFEMTHFPEAVNVPFKQLTEQKRPAQFLAQLLGSSKSSEDPEAWSPKRPTFVICRRGVDSVAATQWLVKSGFSNVRNVDGGYTEFAKEGGADPTFPMY